MTINLPPHQDQTFAWRGEELAATPSRWKTRLSNRQISEIVEAAERYVDSGRPLSAIDAESTSA